LGLAVVLLALLGSTAFYFLRYREASPVASAQEGHYERSLGYYTVVDESGRTVFTTGHAVFVGDEFIAEDDTRYTIVKVEKDVVTARAVGKVDALPPLPALGAQAPPGTLWERLLCALNLSGGSPGRGSVAIYHTHSDESYVPSDGRDAIPARGGVLKVGSAMADRLDRSGLTGIHDVTPHDPHDAQAYGRSRRTASDLLRKYRPLALLDVHRDAGPPEPYLKQVDGKEVAKGMIVIGRQNPKMQTNLEFARRVKDAVNREYPGLIKGIFLGKADFNQDLYDRALLLEVGTEQTSRESAEAGASLIAGVIPSVLGATGPGALPESRGAGRAIGWVLGIVVAGIFAYLWVSTGSWEEMRAKILGWFGAGGIKIGGGRGGGPSDSGGKGDAS